ncbi:MAG: glutamine amidotransferase [Methylophilaceae bacterium]|nr:MAG: glutamine amidotransferase [Methylophilaceae bacterium]
MKPVVVFRHAQCDGAGYLGVFLNQHDIPWSEVRIDLGEPIPRSVENFSGLVFMGGPMSVNDTLPWIPQATRLIRQAIDQDVAVMGHCLGGQLMSKALGAEVTKNPVEEIGWGELQVHENADAEKWFGTTKQFLGFHWHEETFSLPEGATRLLSSQYCFNQAYAVGKHLAMQCHVEMTGDLVKKWYQCWESQLEMSMASPAVQTKQEVLENLSERVQKLNQQAYGLYTRWVDGLSV